MSILLISKYIYRLIFRCIRSCLCVGLGCWACLGFGSAQAQVHQGWTPSASVRFWTQYGNVMQIALPAAAAVTIAADDGMHGRSDANLVHLAKNFAFLNSVVDVSKFTLRERRPAPHNHNYTSFPSGHTASAFAGAAMFIHQYHNPWLRVGALVAASLVGFSRVDSHYHHVQDVLAGAALGSSIMLLPSSDSMRINLAPTGAADGMMVAYTMQF